MPWKLDFVGSNPNLVIKVLENLNIQIPIIDVA